MSFRPGLGISDFRKLRTSDADYVDKTRLITEVIEDRAEILLLPRPRRFGKTINLSTLRYFLEKSDEDRTALFEGLEVWGSERARTHFQRHPVVWISFKDVKFNSWTLTFAALRTEIQRMYDAHSYLLDQGFLAPTDAERFNAILSLEGDEPLYTRALKDLSGYLARYHGEQVVILIDEYDTPIHAGFTNGFYEEVVQFFRALFSSGLKDNPHLFKGVLTGILRVARESLFSGLNNLIVYSLLSTRHATSFGFTEAEVSTMIDGEGAQERLEAIRRWYNGYLFGGQVIYNPWSVLCYIADEQQRLLPYWLMTGSDDLLRDLMIRRGHGLTQDMETLLTGEALERRIDENIVLRDVAQRSDALWSFLLFSGYLKPLEVRVDVKGMTWARLTIPNREIALVYEDVFQRWLTDALGSYDELERLSSALLQGETKRLEQLLSVLLVRMVSYQDPAGREPEKLYQGLLLGLLVHLEAQYEVRSNRESGYGRADVLIRPKQAGRPGVVLELKVLEEDETVEHALKAALEQLRDRQYATELRAAGADPVHELAVVFDGKRARVVKG